MKGIPATAEEKRWHDAICIVDGCEKRTKARGYCSMHHRRVMLYGSIEGREPLIPIGCSVDGCNNKHNAKGFCSKHYYLNKKHGDPTICTVIVGDDIKRFLSKIEVITESGCWIWLGQLHKSGYGVFYLKGKLEQAHRASWMINVGDIPEENQINHKCHIRCCVNPDHLYCGNQIQNMYDMREAGREVKVCGEKSGMSKLNAAEVLSIRHSELSRIELSQKFNISLSLVSAIRNRKIWRHL